MSIVVQLIVSQFDFIKSDHLFHPMRTFRRRILVNVNSRWCAYIAFSRHNPA